jgi:hypothetical protein
MAPIKVNNNGVKREPTKLVGDSITKKKLVGDLIEINMLATFQAGYSPARTRLLYASSQPRWVFDSSKWSGSKQLLDNWIM